MASTTWSCRHEEFAHACEKKHVIGIENVKFLKDHLCGTCEAGKMTNAKHLAKTIMTTTRPHGTTARDRGTTAKDSGTTACERY